MIQHHPILTVGKPRYFPNAWDALAFAMLFGFLVLIVRSGAESLEPLANLQHSALSLDPLMLPEYALRTTMRMLAAITAALIFTFLYATAAAKSQWAELVLIPLLDVLQSVPVLGFLSFTVVGFMALFPGEVLGAELASIFAIFTGQAWNMTFSLYQSLKTVPRDLDEASRSLQLSAWQRFWRLEAPFATPGLVWNTMMSMSGGWFFVVAAETITVGDTSVSLPGVGSYVALAIKQQNLTAIGWAVLSMLLVIIVYDQLLFRPLVAWSEKFRVEQSAGSVVPRSWVLDMVRRTQLFQIILLPIGVFLDSVPKWRLRLPLELPKKTQAILLSAWADRIWMLMVLSGAAAILFLVANYVAAAITWGEFFHVIGLGLITMTRVVVLIVLASLIWVPVGVWIGLRPWLAERVQPFAQFLAAFPANIVFPFAVYLIVYFKATPDIWLSPLMVLGTQWYILFNVIAGASAFPNDLKEAAASFHIRGWRWWRRVILPGILPYYVTGALTASGGSWNASIVAEMANWGNTTLIAHGIGAYIAVATPAGDYRRVVLGVAVMAVLVILSNRLIWRPLYTFAANRLRLD
jgi:NitT/TauT family transport system permease protein